MLLYSRKEGEIMKNIFNQISTNTYEKNKRYIFNRTRIHYTH